MDDNWCQPLSDAYWLVSKAKFAIEEEDAKFANTYARLVARDIAATGEHVVEGLTCYKRLSSRVRTTIRRLRKLGFSISILSIKQEWPSSIYEYTIRVTLPQ